MAKKYKSDAFASIHETMETLFEEGVIDRQAMRGFDDSCLEPSPSGNENIPAGAFAKTQSPRKRLVVKLGS